jgi:hypothetical protein
MVQRKRKLRAPSFTPTSREFLPLALIAVATAGCATTRPWPWQREGLAKRVMEVQPADPLDTIHGHVLGIRDRRRRCAWWWRRRVRLQLTATLAAGLGLLAAPGRAQVTGLRTDTMVDHGGGRVDVVSPQVAASAPLDADGGALSATVAVDIVTAALWLPGAR